MTGNMARSLSVEDIAQRCLSEANNDPRRECALAGRYAHGAKAREVVTAIATALIRASAKGRVS